MRPAIATILLCVFNCNAALFFNGTNAHVNFGDRNSYDAQTKIGIMSWVYMDSGSQSFGTIMADLSTDALNGWALQRTSTSNALHWYIVNGGGNTYADTPLANSMPSNSWHHVALNYDGAAVGNSGRVQIYIDGVSQSLVFNGTIPASIGDNSGPFFLGTFDPTVSGSFGKGYLDDVLVAAGRTFTTSEIELHSKSRVRRLIRSDSEWELLTYPDGATVQNLPIVDVGRNQFNGVATNCVSQGSFLTVP